MNQRDSWEFTHEQSFEAVFEFHYFSKKWTCFTLESLDLTTEWNGRATLRKARTIVIGHECECECEGGEYRRCLSALLKLSFNVENSSNGTAKCIQFVLFFLQFFFMKIVFSSLFICIFSNREREQCTYSARNRGRLSKEDEEISICRRLG